MDRQIHILIFEDNPADVELVKRELRKAGLDFTVEWAPDKEAFLLAVDTYAPDLILADYSVPGFDGMAALTLAKERFPDTPVIIVSGVIRDEAAIDMLKAGAADYVLKDRLTRLRSAVPQALEEARQVALRRQAEERLRQANERLQQQAEELQVQAEELRVANETLEWREREYRTLAENAPEVIARFDKGLRHRYINEYGARVYGVPRTEVIGKTNAELGMPADRVAFWQERFEQVLATGRQQTVDFEFDNPTFGHQCFSSLFVPEFDAGGQIISILAITRDVTETRLAQEGLRESEERQRRLIENLKGSHFIYVHDTKGVFQYVGESVTDILGYTPDEFMTHFSRYMTDDSVNEAVYRHTELSIQGIRQPSYEVNIWHKDGSTRWLEVQEVPVLDATGRVIAVEGVAQDITERKRAEEALRQSEQRLKRAQDIAHLGSWELDLEENELTWSDEVYRIFGLQPQEFGASYEAFLAAVHPEDRGAVDAAYSGSLREGKDRYEIEHRIVRKSTGEVRIVHEKCEHIRDESGRIIRSLGMVHDITERKLAEEALAQRNEFLNSVLESLTHPFYVVNAADYSIVMANTATGLEDRSSAAKCYFVAHNRSVPCPDTDADHPCPLEEVKRTGRSVVVEHVHYDAYGNPRNVEVHAYPLFDAQGRVVQMIEYCLDVTEQKQAEQALRELTATLESRVAQRTAELEQRGRQLQRLAMELSQAEDRERKRLAEILHDDLQQILAAAKFHVGLLSSRIDGDAEAREMTGQIKQLLVEAIGKSRGLSHELNPPVLGQNDLCEIFEWMAEQVRTKHGLKVHVDVLGPIRVESEPLRAFLYKTVQEMLFNVIKHAKVMEATLRLRRARGHLWLCVCDRGRGFDTQESGTSSGFGLLSVRERIELLGGRLRIRSALGKGSVFVISVPDPGEPEPVVEQAGEAAWPAAAARKKRAKSAAGRRLRVLLADDHRVMREGLAALLDEERDIEVIAQAGNGREAIDLAYQLAPDVVIMDVAMPVMAGDEATRQIKLHLPNTRVIALSMFEDTHVSRRMRSAGAEAYLSKTGPTEELLAAIRGR